MANKNKLLSILSDTEQEALYGIPDFDDAQRLEFLALDEYELGLACSRRGLHAQIYCILQIAYFKAKHLFFRFNWSDVKGDCDFIPGRYFHGELLPDNSPSKHERYAQREKICALYGVSLDIENCCSIRASPACMVLACSSVKIKGRDCGTINGHDESLSIQTLMKDAREILVR